MLEHELCQKLIQIKSITPDDNGCLALIASYLPEFTHHTINVKDTSNLFSKWRSYPDTLRSEGEGPRNNNSRQLAFAGHVDVVPVASNWTVDPFGGVIKDGYLYGRGTNDMKGAIACFIAALIEVQTQIQYSVSFLLTSDEEGPALHGTREIVKFLKKTQEKIDLCIIGEPTSKERVGDHIKIGSRGSLNCHIKVHGKSGHVAYPNEALNPIPIALGLAQQLNEWIIDQGNENFQASNLELTSIDVGNKATNVIPEFVDIRFNIRFNDQHTHESLRHKIEMIAKGHEVAFQFCGIPYFSNIDEYKSMLKEAVHPTQTYFSTSGAASDGFMIKDLCPCLELGLFYNQAHQTDERVLLNDLTELKEIYKRILLGFNETL